MRILVAYDGSGSADAALVDLRRAGLPERASVLVVSIAGLWLSFLTEPRWAVKAPADRFDSKALEAYTAAFDARVEEARALAATACARLRASFPTWRVTAAGSCGTPATEILEFAAVWNPTLVVVGSHDRTALGRLLLGSVSRRIAVEARCSVRVARAAAADGPAPARLLVGVDGSTESLRAVRAVARRRWPPGSAVHVVTAGGQGVPGAAGVAGAPRPLRWTRAARRRAEASLGAAGLAVAFAFPTESPADALVRLAESSGADAVFVGSRKPGTAGRLPHGSVSLAVASRAPCSVEIVR
jgi:nucleotide-binding universal stress UspA family protein